MKTAKRLNLNSPGCNPGDMAESVTTPKGVEYSHKILTFNPFGVAKRCVLYPGLHPGLIIFDCSAVKVMQINGATVEG